MLAQLSALNIWRFAQIAKMPMIASRVVPQISTRTVIRRPRVTGGWARGGAVEGGVGGLDGDGPAPADQRRLPLPSPPAGGGAGTRGSSMADIMPIGSGGCIAGGSTGICPGRS